MGAEGRKSEALPPLDEADAPVASPAHQKHRSCTGAEAETGAEEAVEDNASAAEQADVGELRRRIRELETEQRLIQQELDNVSDVAQRTDAQLRYTALMSRARLILSI